MKTTPIALSAALLSLALLACAAPDAAQTTPAPVPVAAKTKATIKPYPLDTCIVTDNELDSMGGEITKVYDGQQIKFCCKPCVKKFEANKPKYLAKLK
ncbi:MAG: hypothetical protein V4689_13925 [Verrucomicrobiota bacterium]